MITVCRLYLISDYQHPLAITFHYSACALLAYAQIDHRTNQNGMHFDQFYLCVHAMQKLQQMHLCMHTEKFSSWKRRKLSHLFMIYMKLKWDGNCFITSDTFDAICRLTGIGRFRVVHIWILTCKPISNNIAVCVCFKFNSIFSSSKWHAKLFCKIIEFAEFLIWNVA